MGKPLLTDEVIEKLNVESRLKLMSMRILTPKSCPCQTMRNQNVSIRVGASKMLDGVNCNPN